MRTWRNLAALLLSCMLVLGCVSSALAVQEHFGAYDTYNYSVQDGTEMAAATAYVPVRVIRAADLGLDSFWSISDIFVDDASGYVFIADTDNHCIVRTTADFSAAQVFTEAEDVAFSDPRGLFVSGGYLYVADTGNKRVAKLTLDGESVCAWGKPDSPQFSTGVDFKPLKVVVTGQGEISIVSEGIYEGLVTIDQNGEFQGYSGTIPVKPSLWELFWRLLSTREQLKSMSSFLPVTYINIDLDENGFIMATSQAEQSTMANSVQRLNPGGNDVLVNNSGLNLVGDFGNLEDGRAFGDSIMADIASMPGGMYACLDSRRSKVFVYDDEGEMLFAFGSMGGQDGNITVPTALDTLGFSVLIADSSKGQITIYEPTAYGLCLMQGIIAYNNSDYEGSRENFTEAFRYNTNCELAYLGIGRSQMREGLYKEAMASFRLAGNRMYYSRALEEYRAEVLDASFTAVFTVVALVLIVLVARPVVKRFGKSFAKEKKVWEPRSALSRWLDDLIRSVDFAFYCAAHPFKGFHELRHEGQGSIAGGTIILIAYVLMAVIRATSSGFLFGGSMDVNPLLTAVSVFGPILLFVLANWCITTLMEGEGRMRDIYKGVCYALMPMALGQILLLVLSNALTLDESAVYNVIHYGLWGYTIFLLLAGNMVAHGFAMGRTVGAAIVTALAMAIIIFLLYLFLNLLMEVAGFGLEIYQEIMFRA